MFFDLEKLPPPPSPLPLEEGMWAPATDADPSQTELSTQAAAHPFTSRLSRERAQGRRKETWKQRSKNQ